MACIRHHFVKNNAVTFTPRSAKKRINTEHFCNGCISKLSRNEAGAVRDWHGQETCCVPMLPFLLVHWHAASEARETNSHEAVRLAIKLPAGALCNGNHKERYWCYQQQARSIATGQRIPGENRRKSELIPCTSHHFATRY